MNDLSKIQQILDLHEEGFRVAVIAHKMDCSNADVYTVLRLAGIKKTQAERPQKYDYGRILELYNSGLSANAVASEVGCSTSLVVAVVAKTGDPRPVNQAHTQERNADIVKRREAGEKLVSIGNHYTISRERVRQVLASMGRADLCPPRPPEQTEKKCAVCPTIMRGCRGDVEVRKYCSVECRAEASRRRSLKNAWPKVEGILDSRSQGHAWAECIDGTDTNSPAIAASRTAARFVGQLGVNLDWAWPGSGQKGINPPPNWKEQVVEALAAKGIPA